MRELIVAIITLIVGFIFLIKGADFFVDGSASVAKRLRVPSIIIGMTGVAMGTSLPECAVSVTASITNNNSLAVSNAVGSNIFNLMVVCGVCALFTPLAVQRDTLKRDLPFSIIVAGLLLVLGYFGMTLGRVDGIILLVVFAVFLVIMVKSALKARRDGDITAAEQEDQEIADEVEILPVWKCIVFIVVGAIGIALGGDAVVNRDCGRIWPEPDADRSYDRGTRNIFAGACDIYCCGTQKRSGYGARKCDWIEYL